MVTLKPGHFENDLGQLYHCSRPLNQRNQLCQWTSQSLCNVSVGHLLGLDLQDMRKVWRAQAAEMVLAWNTWGCLHGYFLVVLSPFLCYPVHCFVLSLFFTLCLYLCLAARKHLWEEVFQHVPPKLPRPDCECNVSRRHYSYWRGKVMWNISPFYEVNIDACM